MLKPGMDIGIKVLYDNPLEVGRIGWPMQSPLTTLRSVNCGFWHGYQFDVVSAEGEYLVERLPPAS